MTKYRFFFEKNARMFAYVKKKQYLCSDFNRVLLSTRKTAPLAENEKVINLGGQNYGTAN